MMQTKKKKKMGKIIFPKTQTNSQTYEKYLNAKKNSVKILYYKTEEIGEMIIKGWSILLANPA